MNTFWLKMAGFAIVVVGLIILVKVFLPPKAEQETEEKSFYDVIKEDDERLRAEPQAKQPPETEQTVDEAEPKLQFKELNPEDKIQAERLFEMALAQRKIGRLPGMSYKLMVDHCREIIEKYPDSVYAFKAKRMLADIPEQYRKQYNITDEEIALPD